MAAPVKDPDVGEPFGPIPADPRRALRARRKQVGLRHIMGLSVVVGVVFAAIAQAYRTGEVVDLILAVMTIGVGVASLGAFLALRLERWGIVGWVFICAGPTAVAAAIAGLTTASMSPASPSNVSPELIVAAVVYVLPVLIGAIVHVTGRLRAAQQESLLWVLALAADRGRPLGPAVKALAESSSGSERVRLRRLAEALDHGLSLPDALAFVPRSATAAAQLQVRVGHDSGALAAALRDAASARSARPAAWRSFGARAAYLCLLFVAIQGITAFLLAFTLPKFEAIFRDFGFGLPAVTRRVIGWGQWALGGYMLPVIGVVEGLLLIYLPFAFGGFAELSVPFLDVLFLRRHSVLILRGLAMVVEGGRPLGPAFRTMAASYPTGWVQERMAGVAAAAEHGVDWIDALRRFGLISGADVALLDAARRAGNLPWALRELAEGSERRLGYRLQAVGQVLTTLLLLALAAFVALFAVAFFYPLITLIERLVA